MRLRAGRATTKGQPLRRRATGKEKMASPPDATTLSSQVLDSRTKVFKVKKDKKFSTPNPRRLATSLGRARWCNGKRGRLVGSRYHSSSADVGFRFNTWC